VTGLAGLMLTTVPGQRARGRAMTDDFVRGGTPVQTLAAAVAAGGEVTAEHRAIAVRIGRRALERAIGAAIDDARFDEAEAAMDLDEILVAAAVLEARERAMAEADAAVLRSYAASRRGNRPAAVEAIETAGRIARAELVGDSLNWRVHHEVRAREIELGLRETPLVPSDTEDCTRDLARRQIAQRAAGAEPHERRALIDALLHDQRIPPAERGRCTSLRGFRETEIRARILLARLLLSCFVESEVPGGRACGFTPDEGLVAIRGALGSATHAVIGALDDIGPHGDVDRSRPFAEIAREIIDGAEEASRFPWSEHRVERAHIDELSWLAFRIHDCVSYPDVRVNLRWLSGVDAPRCDLSADPDPDPDRITLLYVEHRGTRGRMRYAVWVRRGAELTHVDLGRASAVDRAVGELNRALADPAAPYGDLVREVHELVLAPALGRAPADAPLVILPSGGMAAVPFAVLVEDPARLRYALATRPLRDPMPLMVRQAVVVADPIFGSSGGQIARLPGTRGEADAVCEALDCGGRRLVGADATEPHFFSAVQERLGEYGVVHLATHGVFGGTDGVSDRAAILLAGVGDALPESTPWDSGADGMVSESELAALGLDRTDLVVLSACGTGRGRSRVGVRGLARAARVSGARAVIGSLWSVDDRATGVLMREFYRRLRRGMTMNVALAEASAVVRAQNGHPYYWAPFVLLESH
jgi:CHAT domain-containing protein